MLACHIHWHKIRFIKYFRSGTCLPEDGDSIISSVVIIIIIANL